MKMSHPGARPNQKVVIVAGAGFAGLSAAKKLARQKELYVVVVDQRNHHLFQPLLYQVATAGLDPADISVPIRGLFNGYENVAVHLGNILSVDLDKKTVNFIDDFRLEYDYLILACGASHSYFGKPQWEEFAPGLKTLEQATEIRRRTLLAFERAENELDPEKQRALLNFVIIGGGPTGVELAGAISDISRTVLVRDFRRINPVSAKVYLLQSGPRILATFSEKLSKRATADLTKMGVEVRTHSRVDQIDESGVRVGGEFIPSRTVLWAAGVQAPELSRTLGVEIDKAGRIKVGPDLSIPQHPKVFVIGDFAHFDLSDKKILPGLAPAAIQTGVRAAENIIADLHGKERKTFHYFDKGQMATIGKRKAVCEVKKFRMAGYPAWLAWAFVHILYMVGHASRILVFTKWIWSYVFSERGSRLILNENWRSPQKSQEKPQGDQKAA